MKRTVDVNIPLGPIHPCFKEPARVKCETKGERVIGAEVELGYMKKGIERIMKAGPGRRSCSLPSATGSSSRL
jgi:energy-converting hydrogenase A subunit O